MAKKVWIVEELLHAQQDFREIKHANTLEVCKHKKKAIKTVVKAVKKYFKDENVDPDNVFWRLIEGKDVYATIIATENATLEYIIEKVEII